MPRRARAKAALTPAASVSFEETTGFRDSREIETLGELTPRQLEVLRFIAEGLSTKDIAARLNITRKTVEYHRSRLTKRLGIYAIALLARYAVRMGAIPP